jgi:hypothetical protein
VRHVAATQTGDFVMKRSTNAWILRANAIYLLVASMLGTGMDIAGIYFGFGPEARAIASAPLAGLGFLEAHGLAFILGCVLWSQTSTRFAHLTAFAVVALLGTCNLAFWDLFVSTDSLAVGYLATSGHWFFATLQLIAAAKPDQSGLDLQPRKAHA